ncbi:DUF1932 domain-containing protein [Sphaerisporangium corydalis]|uniref:DUF1932 domain-containing protein n=1 Tax=Sphaerisporangium corydalis TaxID=1441875 RepID=A0ABV9ELS8_9ACTN|nr:DUF1932 domain-containing protein [Sphaerisporangium corydalis]
MVTVAVLGLGEAGGLISRDLLAAGAKVRGYDPVVRPGPGVIPCSGEADAATGADLVLSVNSAAAAEELTAARAAGLEDWLRENIGEELAAADASFVTRLEEGTIRHAERRAHEMTAAAELLAELEVPVRITEASLAWLAELAAAGSTVEEA